ncbi:MAG: hypothetical protein AUK23_04455 [Deltaproteobacteria bacterium CG2_30_43_15]|nr:MAG: hypothetical protein AUK23_04455 [Deltaproteobacteria bacterium CG2_30_43_15]
MEIRVYYEDTDCGGVVYTMLIILSTLKERERNEKLLASGMTRLACINKNGKPVRIPDSMLKILSN